MKKVLELNKTIQGLKYYQQSASQGHITAQFSLGYMYDKGIGVEQNYPEALKYYQQAASQGDITAQFNLGCMYYNGYGIKQNYPKA